MIHSSRALIRFAVTAFMAFLCIGPGSRAALGVPDPPHRAVSLPGHIPVKALARAKWVGRHPADRPLPIAIALPWRNQAELQDLLNRLYDPADPLYGRYLTASEFTARFAPSEADYEAVAAHLIAQGFKITHKHANRLFLQAEAQVPSIESAFKVQLHRYQGPGGRDFYAPDREPVFPEALASRLLGVIGLDNAAVWRNDLHRISPKKAPHLTPSLIGTGPKGGLTPQDLARAYNLKGSGATGAGQILAVMELSGYTAADITFYQQHFGLPAIPLQNVRVGGVTGQPDIGSDEVTLDLELQMALAPGARKIIVYEGPNSDSGILHTFNRIATDNRAKQISTSWGSSEDSNTPVFLAAENQIFQQMAAQGQSVFAPSGDSGAYDNLTMLSVDDPAAQPYVVSVGGTQLSVFQGKRYGQETTWNSGSLRGGASGGGISQFWSLPAYQSGLSGAASTAMRNVPDVALNAAPETGYAVYYNGTWQVLGGTSAAAPLWAAFTARVNQRRLANGNSWLGFANPALYAIAQSARYPADFHDIDDGSTNFHYPATPGYDNATGWGSFNGANLLADLAPPPPPRLRRRMYRPWREATESGSPGVRVRARPDTISTVGRVPARRYASMPIP